MPLDRNRPWECRMFQARRYLLHRLKMLKRQHENVAMMEFAASVIKAKMPGWSLAPPWTREDLLNDYRRVIRRNLWTTGKLP